MGSCTVNRGWGEMGQRQGWSHAPSKGRLSPHLRQSDNLKVTVTCGQVWMERENPNKVMTASTSHKQREMK